MNRRSLVSAAALAATTGLAIHQSRASYVPYRRPRRSHVAILHCDRYERTPQVVEHGLQLVRPSIQGKRVLLKPNLVEYSPAAPINTHPMLIAAVIDALYRLGAASVIVADGPGHIRDTDLLLDESGLGTQLEIFKRAKFVDLNFDSVTRVVPGTGLTQLEELWLPTTVQSTDVVISMPKIKTHHWAGVTLSLKNSFGILPGSIYGWPKNVLHWQGIDNSIVELAVSVPIHFVIADGIEAMEGNGPLHGPMRRLGCLVFADDPVAADATCCRLMGIDPGRVRHLQMASPLGNLDIAKIEQRGESVEGVMQRFELLPEFAHLRG
ncbi:MAG TPA: DUF362 domain-containing protein [Terriglobales bacterium]|nr:DUF362 domain-containing protein [Terriglobales bacterium]